LILKALLSLKNESEKSILSLNTSCGLTRLLPCESDIDDCVVWLQRTLIPDHKLCRAWAEYLTFKTRGDSGGGLLASVNCVVLEAVHF
jgi:hypothetical protein